LLCAASDWKPAGYSNEYLHAAQPSTVELSVAGQEQIVLSSGAPHCPGLDAGGERMDVPDAPLRVIRLGTRLLATAAHYDNLAYSISSDLATLGREGCASMLPSKLDGDPSHFSDHEWLVSMYVLGDRIFGLVHDEYWGGLYNKQCSDRLGKRSPWDDVCLYGNLAGSASKDGAKTFQRSGVVAAYPYAFAEDMNRNGVRDPSNVFYNPGDGYVYFMSWVDPRGDQKGGECLFRSKEPFSNTWLAWDGHGFSASMGSPFRHQEAICEPVSGLWITTVVYSAAARTFVALAYDERIKPGGVFYRTSTDLIHWSKAEFLMEAHNHKYWKKNDKFGPIVYPSLIDPGSTSPNFDTVDGKPYLYFIRWAVKDRQPQGREREIVRVPLTLKSIGIQVSR
jgi:hypothetical protein